MNRAGMVDIVPSALRRQWLASGVCPNRSVSELFFEHAYRQPDAPAVLAPGETVTYRTLADAVLSLAARLKQLGIVEGDVVAYQLPNTWRCCAIDLAVAALGGVVAPFPPGRGRLDMESLLRRCAARAVIVEPGEAELKPCEIVESLRPTLLSLRVLIVDGEAPAGWHALSDLLAAAPLDARDLPAVDTEAPVRLLVSSGTESEPKLVAYSHNALIGGRGQFLCRLHSRGEPMRVLYLVPLGSSFGSTATFGVLSLLGGSIVVLPRFSVRAAIEAIAALKPGYLFGVPTMLQRLAAEPALAGIDKTSLSGLVCGGAVIDESTIRRCVAAFGCAFINLYGSADGVNCHNLVGDPLDLVCRSVGRPNPAVCAIRIVDEDRKEVPHGTVGEISARGAMSPMQYVNAPDLDARYRDGEGWVYTGDLGFIDGDGYLVLAGRKKDIIVRGGANISPAQIERLATSHPDVVSAACIPIPDADLGQRVGICLTLREGAARPSLGEFSAYLSAHGLEQNKLPDYLRFCRRMPFNAAGKIDKKRLAEEVSALLASDYASAEDAMFVSRSLAEGQ